MIAQKLRNLEENASLHSSHREITIYNIVKMQTQRGPVFLSLDSSSLASWSIVEEREVTEGWYGRKRLMRFNIKKLPRRYRASSDLDRGVHSDELRMKASKDSSEARRRFDVRLCEVDRRMDRANERKLGREGRGRRVCYVKRLRMEKGGRLLLETGAWSGLRTR